MQARHGRQFVVDHALASALILAALVSSVTVVVTLFITGDLPSASQASTEVDVPDVAVIIPDDRMGLGAGEARNSLVGDAYHPSLGEGWIGSGAPAQEWASAPRGADRVDELTRIQEQRQVPSVQTWDSRLELRQQAPGLFSAPQVESGVSILEGWEYHEYNPDIFAPSQAASSGTGEGMMNYQFIEENTYIPGSQSPSSSPGPGEGIRNYQANDEPVDASGSGTALPAPIDGLTEY